MCNIAIWHRGSLDSNYKWLRLHFLTFFFLVPAALFDQVNREQCTDVLFTDPQIPLFSHFFIKNGSHNTIYTFKNYFIRVFSVFSFQFQQNKFYPNRLINVLVYRLIKFKCRGASILGVVARDEMQSYVKAWTKKFNLNDPLMAKAVFIKGSL